MWFDLVLTQLVDRLQFANLDDQMHDFPSLSYESFNVSSYFKWGAFRGSFTSISSIWFTENLYIHTR